VVFRGDSARCSVASTICPVTHEHQRWAAQLPGQPLSRALDLLAGADVTAIPFGLAAANARLAFDLPLGRSGNAFHTLVEHGRNRRVALVGHFPFVERLRPVVGHLDVLELEPRDGDLPADQAEHALPLADVVAVTGTAVLNDTLAGLLPLLRPAAFNIMLGPSTPLHPLLLQWGFHVIGGATVSDIPALLESMDGSASTHDLRGHRLVMFRAEDWAGRSA